MLRLKNDMKVSSCLILIFTLAISFPTIAQIFDPSPPAPTVGSIRKFIDYPVGSYTGGVPVNVDLFSINAGDIHVPISLSYHTGGVIVSDEAGWVGTNWALNAGGVINQTVKGYDDFGSGIAAGGFFSGSEMIDPICGASGYLFDPFNAEIGYNGFCTGAISLGMYSRVHSMKPLVNGLVADASTLYETTYVDWEPDMYSFSIPGNSGRFTSTQDKNFYLLEQQNIKISHENQTTDGLWKIVDSGGRTYTFSRLQSETDMGELTGRSWYLTKITSATGNREVTFEYENGPQSAMTHTDWSFSQTLNSSNVEAVLTTPGGVGKSYAKLYTPVYLKKIIVDDGTYYMFDRKTTPREDLRGEYALQYVRQYNAQGQLQKEFELVTEYRYSQEIGTNPYVSYENQTEKDYDYKRLFLTSLIERGTGGESLRTEFTYNATPLPQKTSFARDHWGYFNGVGNSTLLPGFRKQVNYLNGTVIRYKVTGADRNPSEQLAQAGTLVKITYPTGGSTTFDYSVHRYKNVSPNYHLVTAGTNKVIWGGNSSQSPPISTTIPSGEGSENAYLLISGACADCSFMPSPSYVNITYDGELRSLELYTLEYNYPQLTDETFSTNPNTYSFNFKIYLTDLFDFCCEGGLFQASIDAPNAQNFSISASVYYEDLIYPAYKLAGGLRVTKKTDIDENQVKRSFEMLYDEGILFSEPSFTSLTDYNEAGTFSVIVSSSSITTPAGAAGGNVGYGKVTVLHGTDGSNGKTEYFYHSNADQWVNYEHRNATIPKVPNAFNGRLSAKIDYKNVAGTFHMVRIDSMFYNIGLNVRIPAIASAPASVVSLGYVYQELHYYPIFSTWVRQYKSSTTEFLEGGNLYSVTFNNYKPVLDNTGNVLAYYPDEEEFLPPLWPKHLSPISVSQNRSDGKSMQTRFLYADDFASPALPVQKMLDMNMDDTPIIEQTLIDGGVVNATAKKFMYDATLDKIRLSSLYNLEAKIPVTDLSTGSTGVAFDSRMTQTVEAIAYDTKGNLLEMKSKDNPPVTFLYGYNESLPVAKIENATYAQVSALLGTSNMNVLKGISPSDVQVRSIIQLIRQGMPSSRVTTYTHSPGDGITSITDANNQTTFYSYDFMGRLELIKDASGSILKHITYHYKGN